MAQQADNSLSLRDAIRAINQHKGKSLLLFLLVMVVATIGVFCWPKTYRSEGKLFVRQTAKQVTQDPTLPKGTALAVTDTRELEINSIVDILKSRQLAEKVVGAIGEKLILQDEIAEQPDATPDVADELGLTPDLIRSHSAIRKLLSSLSVNSPEKSAIIDISYDAPSPLIAQKVVAEVMKQYVTQHIEVTQVGESFSFFEEQSRLLKKELDENAEALRQAKNEIGIATIEGKRAMLEAQMSSIEAKIIDTERELFTAAARVAKIRETIATIPEEQLSETTNGIANNAADNMRNELYRVQAREQELMAQYKPDHPAVVAVRQQVAELKEIHDAQEVERTQFITRVNPAHETFNMDLLSQNANIASLTAQADKLKNQLSDVTQKLVRLSESEIRIHELQRNVDLAEVNYRMYAEKLETVRMLNALERDNISNVQVVQNATLASKAVSPRKGIILGLAFVIACVGAVGLPILLACVNPQFGSREDIEHQLNVPVLTTIPRVPAQEVWVR